MIEVQEAENQIVVAYEVYDQRPADSALLIPAIEQHRQRLGVVPRVAPGDAGFFSAANEKAAEKLGVARVAVPFLGTQNAERRKLTGNIRQSLIVLMGAVGAVLLVLCVNLANLSLARVAGRARDSGIRTALGASRGQLLRQFADGERTTERDWRRGRNIAGVLGSAVAAGGRADRPSASGRRSPGRARAAVRAGDFAGDGADLRHSSGAAQRGFAQRTRFSSSILVRTGMGSANMWPACCFK
jgi:hypothetical protein